MTVSSTQATSPSARSRDLVDERSEHAPKTRVGEAAWGERADAHPEVVRRRVRLEPGRRAGRLLHEQALDRELQVVDAVERQLEPRGETPEDEHRRTLR